MSPIHLAVVGLITFAIVELMTAVKTIRERMELNKDFPATKRRLLNKAFFCLLKASGLLCIVAVLLLQ